MLTDSMNLLEKMKEDHLVAKQWHFSSFEAGWMHWQKKTEKDSEVHESRKDFRKSKIQEIQARGALHESGVIRWQSKENKETRRKTKGKGQIIDYGRT